MAGYHPYHALVMIVPAFPDVVDVPLAWRAASDWWGFPCLELAHSVDSAQSKPLRCPEVTEGFPWKRWES